MNKIRQINQINQKELASSTTSYKSSWHYEYRDTNYIYISNIPNFIKPHDLVVIFSQYGIPTHLNLVKSREVGQQQEQQQQQQHRGFAFLKYANFKSCILAIDNFNGIKVGDRMLHVDHSYYKLRSGQKEDDYLINYDEVRKQLERGDEESKEVKLIKSDHDDGVSERKAIEYNSNSEEREERTEEDAKEDEFADPMQAFGEKMSVDEKAVADEDDEFIDPMEQFITETKESKEKTHKSSRSGRHRSHHRSHRSRDKASSSHRKDRDRSPTRESKKQQD
ncbi:hypothetical protein CANMA_001935 [Candida margitis]|uniref:uncharacterized protein n=1 Tax=Candida margitis TaxID=1775924 RepID=UPI0022274C73|nr:uncharacterized protein CANMA_001935 [Candida margitis]KAI5969045.1 hypothetical protein CANMA_001935 [Candida margitis]